MIELATEYGRYGYRRITGMLRGEGFKVNHKRGERLGRREGLKFRRNSLNAGGCGSTTVRAFDFVRHIETTCGVTALYGIGPAKVESCGC